MKITFIAFLISIVTFAGCGSSAVNKENRDMKSKELTYEVSKSENEWKETLTPEQFRVLRKKGTELAFTGKYYHNKEKGLYVCAACGNPLFHSDAKFDSGTGWPSYWRPVFDKSVVTLEDYSHNMRRVEVLCGKCGGHLGHVFDDGPKPTGLRYCINSVSLDFQAGKEEPK